MPPPLRRLTAVLALTALTTLLAAGAFIFLSPAAAQEADNTPYLVNYAADIETSCDRSSGTIDCSYDTKYFVFDTKAEFVFFLQRRSDFRQSLLIGDTGPYDHYYWHSFRQRDSEWPADTQVSDRSFPGFEGGSFTWPVPTACTDNIHQCLYHLRRFTFTANDETVTFLQDRLRWLQALEDGDESVAADWWEDYTSIDPPASAPAPTPPFLANQVFTVELACPDGRSYEETCTTGARYFNFHTEAEHLDFLLQRGDWHMSRFDGDTHAPSPATVDRDYWKSFTNSAVRFNHPALDSTVSADLNREDVAASVNAGCSADLSHCTQLTRYFDFADNDEAVDFAQQRLAWLEDRFAADTSASNDWWREFYWTTAAGDRPYLQNQQFELPYSCIIDWDIGTVACDANSRYFNFAAPADYGYFLKKQGDFYSFFIDRHSGLAHQWHTWSNWDHSVEPHPENQPSDPVKTDWDFENIRVYVPIECASNISDCTLQERVFHFNSDQQMVDFFEARHAWLATYHAQDEDGASHDWWESYRSWEWQPDVLQGLRINNIPWCQREDGEQACYEVTRYFWHDDWRERGEFQRAHEAWQDGTATDWKFWMDYDWGFDSDGTSTWNDGQNVTYNVPVACTGPYSCVHDRRYINFDTPRQKRVFEVAHSQRQNDGTQPTFYWLSYRYGETPH